MFLKFLVKQLRHWVFYGAIWLLHLGMQRKLPCTLACKGSCIQNIGSSSARVCSSYWHPYNETETKKVEKVQKTSPRWTCRRWQNKSSVRDMLDELEWPSLQDCRVKSSITFFYKIHSGTVSFVKDRYLTPASNLRSTRASHD